MTQDVTQWLTEIKSLQQQLIEARQERDEAYASAANWRKLYETEAKQRRAETNLARQTVDALKAEIQQFQAEPQAELDEPTIMSAIQQEIEHLQSTGVLKEKLAAVLIERDRLAQALKLEQAQHAQTRKSLTTALGDTVDMLTKERSAQQGGSLAKGTTGNSKVSSEGDKPEGLRSGLTRSDDAKTPLPELPHLSGVQFPV